MRFAKTRKQYRTKIEDRISQLRNNENNYSKMFGFFGPKTLNGKASKELFHLYSLFEKAEEKALADIPNLDFRCPYLYQKPDDFGSPFFSKSEQRYNGWYENILEELQKIVSDYKSRLRSLEYELRSIHEEKARKNREKEQRAAQKRIEKEKNIAIMARVAKAEGKTRGLAVSVKSILPKDHPCPYCGHDLGESPHADHIYPVVRGGLSSIKNMVYVCADCNAYKRDKTLRMFIQEFGLDRDFIEENLIKLGKEF